MKIRPVEAESLHVDTRMDGQTDRNDEANTVVTFSKFLYTRHKLKI